MVIKKRAFTMIELMGVLLIIGTLVAVVAVRVRRGQAQAKVTETKATIESIKTAVAFYKQDKGKYPTTGEGLKVLVGTGIEKSQLTDGWGSDFEYNAPPVKHKDKFKNFEIISYGPDKEESADDIYDGE